MLHVPSDHIWRPDIVLYNKWVCLPFSLFNILITSSIVPHYIHFIHIVVAQHAAKRLESVWTFISLRSRRVVVYDVIFLVQQKWKNKLRSKKEKKKNFSHRSHFVFLKISDIRKKDLVKKKKWTNEKQVNISRKIRNSYWYLLPLCAKLISISQLF